MRLEALLALLRPKAIFTGGLGLQLAGFKDQNPAIRSDSSATLSAYVCAQL